MICNPKKDATAKKLKTKSKAYTFAKHKQEKSPIRAKSTRSALSIQLMGVFFRMHN